MTLTIRIGTIDDLPLLICHRRKMFTDMKDFPAAQLDAQDADWEKWAGQRLRAGTLIPFIAEDGGRVVASACIFMRERTPYPGYAGGPSPQLMSMFTEHDQRRKGVATAIVEATQEYARKHGARFMTLQPSDRGQSIYGKLGFKPTNEMRWDVC